MEILIIPRGLTGDLMNQRLEKIKSRHLDSIKKELKSIDKKYKCTTTNLGTGADWLLIWFVLAQIKDVLMSGDKIDSTIKGWVKVAKRIKKIFKKSDKIYFDNDAATILAIDYIVKETKKVKSIEKISEQTIHLKDLSGMLLDRKKKDFIARPYCIYIHSYQINDDKILVLGIKSNGHITEIYSFDNLWTPMEPF